MKTSSKKKTAYFCTSCGAMHHRWQGQCRECGEWNSLHEEILAPARNAPAKAQTTVEAATIPEIDTDNLNRIICGINEFDRVLGGGAVPGSALLVGGEPGIGKSSLLLQAAEFYGSMGLKSLYISGEESAVQIKDRATRFGISGETITVANLSDLDEIITIAKGDYQIIIIDSIQTVASSILESPPGTVGQVRESSARLIEMTKRSGKVLFLVGHITKDGSVAGPKVLEHMVDTVLYFEGDRFHLYRILRSQKNRFGPAGEIGVFEMTGKGLLEIKNPSQIFMTAADGAASPGRVVSAAVEGSRSFLVEIEALVASSHYGTPQRVASGIDARRLAIIAAVLEKRGGVVLGASDIFVNVAGGIRIDDTAVDLAFLIAVASSKLNVSVDGSMLVVGEIGLSGDIRGVSQVDRRLVEAARMGITAAMVPRANAAKLGKHNGIQIISVRSVDDALQHIR